MKQPSTTTAVHPVNPVHPLNNECSSIFSNSSVLFSSSDVSPHNVQPRHACYLPSWDITLLHPCYTSLFCSLLLRLLTPDFVILITLYEPSHFGSNFLPLSLSTPNCLNNTKSPLVGLKFSSSFNLILPCLYVPALFLHYAVLCYILPLDNIYQSIPFWYNLHCHCFQWVRLCDLIPYCDFIRAWTRGETPK